MIRTQIQLTDDQHRWLRRWAQERGISMSEAVRRCIAERRTQEEGREERVDRVREALTVVGKYADPEGPSRVARDHDEILSDSYRS
jgi:hypothetical protein